MTGVPVTWDAPTQNLAAIVSDLRRPPEGVPDDEFADAVEEICYALSLLPGPVAAVRDEFEQYHGDPDRDTVTCWTLQRSEVWQRVQTDGQHVASWDTVRTDRRPQYAFIVAAMLADGFGFECEPGQEPPPFWAYTSRSLLTAEPWSLDQWVCDSTCGEGLPAPGCHSTHIPPGHVAIELTVDLEDMVGLSWRRWDIALRGGYLPADDLDGNRFGRALAGHEDDPPRDWPWRRRIEARASMLRCFTTDNSIPGMAEHDHRNDPGWYRNQLAVPTLELADVTATADGPSTDATVWWDAAVAVEPGMAMWRRHHTMPADRLHEPGRDGDSA
jgi:hypothetical protein